MTEENRNRKTEVEVIRFSDEPEDAMVAISIGDGPGESEEAFDVLFKLLGGNDQ